MLSTSFEQQLQSLKTSVNDRKSDLDVLSTHQSSVVEADIQNARVANINAMAKLFSLVQYIQKVDDALLGRSFIGMWKSVEAIMEEEHPKIQQLMDDVEPSLAGADKVAGLALQNAMDLALRVSVFYDTKVMKLEQQLVETSDELQNVIRENTNAIAKAQASQERLANKVELKQGEKQRLGLRTSEVEYDGQNALKVNFPLTAKYLIVDRFLTGMQRECRSGFLCRWVGLYIPTSSASRGCCWCSFRDTNCG